jgi:hypothetical protein
MRGGRWVRGKRENESGVAQGAQRGAQSGGVVARAVERERTFMPAGVGHERGERGIVSRNEPF